MYHICNAVEMLGVFLLICEMAGVGAWISGDGGAFNGEDRTGMLTRFALSFSFYGIYFGLLSRDSVQLLADSMAASIGVFTCSLSHLFSYFALVVLYS